MQREEATESARRLVDLERLQEAGLAVIWQDELQALQAQAREAERLHQEIRALRDEMHRMYQGDPLLPDR